MSWFHRFLGTEERAISYQDAFGRGLDLFGPRTAAGETVSRDSALALSAVWGCVRIISENVSTLPVDSYRRQNGVRLPYRPAPQWLHNPSLEFGRIEFVGQVMVSMLLQGNAYVATTRKRNGQVIELIVLDPAGVQPERVEVSGKQRLLYRVSGDLYGPQDILHIPGMMLPGAIKGLSPIEAERETIGLGLAAQKYGAAFFGNGGVPGSVVEVPGKVSPVGVSQLKAAWNDVHQGAGNAHRLAVLTEGAKFATISLPPDAAQFLQTRAFQVPDIARIFGVPPHLLADASNSTSWGSGLEEQNVAFVQYTLRAWMERIESGLTRLLHSEGLDPSVFVKFNAEGLQRGAYKTRMEGYQIALLNGILNLDEVRALEDRPPLPDELGKIHYRPANVMPVGEEPETTAPNPAQPIGGEPVIEDGE